jgi:hypothetical protein
LEANDWSEKIDDHNWWKRPMVYPHIWSNESSKQAQQEVLIPKKQYSSSYLYLFSFSIEWNE